MCATYVESIDWFLLTIIDRYRLSRYMTCPTTNIRYIDSSMRDDWTQPMLDGALTLIAQIVNSRLYNGNFIYLFKYRNEIVGQTETETVRKELCSALCVIMNGKYSKLKDSLPTRGVKH